MVPNRIVFDNIDRDMYLVVHGVVFRAVDGAVHKAVRKVLHVTVSGSILRAAVFLIAQDPAHPAHPAINDFVLEAAEGMPRGVNSEVV